MMIVRNLPALLWPLVISGTLISGGTKPFSVLSPVLVKTSSLSNPSFVIAGDFNGDGKSDILFCSAPNSTNPFGSTTYVISVFLSRGDRTFATAPDTSISLNVASVLTADFNQDGKLDLVVAGATSNGSDVLVLLGKGDGTFAGPIDEKISAGAPLFVADFNHDRIPDLLAAGSVYFGVGDGNFKNPLVVPITVSLVADFNNDGIPDLLGAGNTQGIGQTSVLLGKVDGSFGGPIALPTPPSSVAGIAAADLNKDGNVDLVFPGPAQYVSPFVPQTVAGTVLLGNGDGTFRKTSVPLNGFGSPILLADFNGDGIIDIISNYGALMGNGDGTFQSAVYFSLPFSTCTVDKKELCSGGVMNAVDGDFNGDGLPDVVLQYYDYIGNAVGFDYITDIEVFLNDSPGDGFTNPAVSAPTGTTPVGINSIVTAYGANLSATTASAAGPPYPTSLGGIQLHIADQLAQLLYVSPTQINYILPQMQLSNQYFPFSTPAISLERLGQPFVPKGLAVPMVLDSPSVFTVDSSGLAAATAISVASDGSQTPVQVFDCSASPCAATPIGLSASPVYLSLYATGIGYLFPPNETTLQCSSMVGTVTYAGPQGQIPGLQQINLLLRNPNLGTATKGLITCNTLVSTFEGNFTVPGNTVYVVVR